jgi:hypothetical protein
MSFVAGKRPPPSNLRAFAALRQRHGRAAARGRAFSIYNCVCCIELGYVKGE